LFLNFVILTLKDRNKKQFTLLSQLLLQPYREDEKDTPFIALKCEIWTNDGVLINGLRKKDFIVFFKAKYHTFYMYKT